MEEIVLPYTLLELSQTLFLQVNSVFQIILLKMCSYISIPGSVTMRFGEPVSKFLANGRCLGTLSVK